MKFVEHLIGVIDKNTELKEIEGEIDEIKWISAKELLLELKDKSSNLLSMDANCT